MSKKQQPWEGGAQPWDAGLRAVERLAYPGAAAQPSTLYRTLWLNDLGYVVYRHCFDEKKCDLEDGARTHKQAVFVHEYAAVDYCRYRNALIDKRGTDEL